MKIKKELLSLLVSYGMTSEEIAELASRLTSNVDYFKQAEAQAKAQLDHNEVVKTGLISTIADAQSKIGSAELLLSKIMEVDDGNPVDKSSIT